MKALVNETLNQMLRNVSERYPDRTALIFKDCSMTYQALEEQTNRITRSLKSRGVRKGTHVAILSENTANAVLAFLSVIKAGGVACMLNTSLKNPELLELLRISDIEYLMIGQQYKENLFYPVSRELSAQYPLQQIFDISTEHSSPYMSLEELAQAGTALPGQPEEFSCKDDTLTPQDPALILYTSGTTGQHPKAVLSTHYHLVNGGIQKADTLALTKEDVVCCALQLFHIFCIDVDVMAAFSTGACLAMPDDLHSASILHCLTKHQCSVLSCVPFTFCTMMKKGQNYPHPFPSLRTGIIGGAYCSPEMFTQIEGFFGFTLLPGLGQTEATAGIAVAELEDSLELRSTTVGHFVNHCEGKIIDLKDGSPLPQKATGEICVRGSLLMSEYYKRPDLTSQVIDADGWLHTGDLGWMDSENYIHYVGRKKELINRGGEKIIPAEVESCILQLKQVDTCKVIGIPDSLYGEEVCACIIRKPDTQLAETEVLKHLGESLAPFKMPRHIVFLDSFPRNASGKISLTELTSIAENQIKTGSL